MSKFLGKRTPIHFVVVTTALVLSLAGIALGQGGLGAEEAEAEEQETALEAEAEEQETALEAEAEEQETALEASVPVEPPPPVGGGEQEVSEPENEEPSAPEPAPEPAPESGSEQRAEEPLFPDRAPVVDDDDDDDGEPTGQNCVGRGEARWVYHHLIAGAYNPLGAEWSGRVGICAPLIRRPGVLFDLSNIEFGLLHALSPAYGHLGVYLQVDPLSILSFRAEAAGVLYWEFPLDRAAYFPVDSYYESIDPDNYPAEMGQTAGGWNVNFFTTLRARVSIGRVGIIFIDQLGVELWSIGDEDYYVNLRKDVILQRFDYLLSNEAMVLTEVPITPRINFRVGAFDTLRYVPEADMLNNIVGLLAMLNWPESGPHTRGITPFFRLGWYTHRPEQTRGRTVFFLGVLFDLDLASAGGRAARAGR